MSLLRQWPMLEAVLAPALVLLGPAERLVVWNHGCIDDALAVALLWLHCRLDRRLGDVIIFHSGPDPGCEPVQWRPAEIRGVPRGPWLTPSASGPGRWAPDGRAMGMVVLSPPPVSSPVDVVVVPDRPSVTSGRTSSALPRLCRDGLLLIGDPGGTGSPLPPRFEAVDAAGHLFRKVSGPERSDAGAVRPAQLGRTLARHDEESRLVHSYMNLARSLARRFSHRGERPEDLEQVAMLALMKAAGRYSPEAGGFSSFATTSIVGELKRHFRDRTAMVRLPRSLQERNLEIRAARDELAQRHGSSPTIPQIAEHLGVTDEMVLEAMDAADSCWVASLDTPGRDDVDEAVTHVPVDDHRYDRSLDRWLLQEAIPHLGATEQLIIKRLYFEGSTQKQVAEEIGVSQMQVSRLLARTLARLRTSLMPA